MYKIHFDESNRNKFPVGTLFLVILFYFIGLLTYEGGSLERIGYDYFNITIIKSEMRAQFALVPEYHMQWQFLSYGFIHFALVHYAYMGVLMFYYIQGLEKASSAKFVIISFIVLSTIWPILIGFFFLCY